MYQTIILLSTQKHMFKSKKDNRIKKHKQKYNVIKLKQIKI